MNEEQFNREKLYQITLSIARTMLQRGLLTADELTQFDTKMREKYKPLLGTLYPLKLAITLDK